MREIAQKLSRCSSFGALMDDAFARCPEREAIVYEDWRLTYGDLERYIHQTAHYLRHLGVRKGSRVAILSRNCPEWIIAEFALYQLGAIVVKINWRLTPPEQARMLARNQVSVAFFKAEGKLMPEDIPEILNSGNRTLAGPTAPPGGLYLTRVWYEDERLNG